MPLNISPISRPSSPPSNTVLVCLHRFGFLRFHVEVRSYSFCVFLSVVSLNICSGSIPNGEISHICHIFIHCLDMDTGCFCILSIVRMLIHVGGQVSLEILSPSPLCIYPEVELLCYTVVLFFNVLRKLHIVFHSGCNNLHSHQQCTRVPFSLYTCQYLLAFVFLMTAILTGVRRYLMVLICISLMLNIYLCTHWPSVSFLGKKCVYSCFAQFLIRLLIFVIIEFYEFLIWLF